MKITICLKLFFVIFFLISPSKSCETCLDCYSSVASNTFNTVSLPKKCPQIAAVKNFQLNLITGVWYLQISNLNLKQFGCSDDCVSIYVVQVEHGNATIDLTCSKSGNIFSSLNSGSRNLVQPDPRSPGHLQNVFKNAIVDTFALDVEYDNHLTLYSCYYNGNKQVQVGEIYTRSPTISNALRNELFSKLEKVFENSSAIIDHRNGGRCRYPYFNY